MVFRERVYSVLLVSSAEKFNHSLISLLPEADYSPVNIVTSVGAAKRELLERSYDFILINSPLPDDFGIHLAADICSDSSSVAMMFVRNELFNEVNSKVIDFGVITLAKPISTQLFSQSLRLLCATRERLRQADKKTSYVIEKNSSSFEEKMEEIRIVNKAKWILIDELKMTEPDAHRYIEKQAMDRCISRRDIAEGIIKTYR